MKMEHRQGSGPEILQSVRASLTLAYRDSRDVADRRELLAEIKTLAARLESEFGITKGQP